MKAHVIDTHVICQAQSQLLGQFLEKPCLCSKGHIFDTILVKCARNVCPHEISYEIENGSCWVKN